MEDPQKDEHMVDRILAALGDSGMLARGIDRPVVENVLTGIYAAGYEIVEASAP
jgi:hypothetical protein